MVTLIIALGLSVHILAVGIDRQRFFFEHNLSAFYSVDGQLWYSKDWQPSECLGQIVALRVNGILSEARYFNPSPDRSSPMAIRRPVELYPRVPAFAGIVIVGSILGIPALARPQEEAVPEELLG
jgi:hypothetical protein